MADKSCQLCGRLYGKGTRNEKQYLASKFCSAECFGKARTEEADARRAATVKQCRECGKDYHPHYGQIIAFENSKYCSHACANQKQRTIDTLYSRVRIDPVTGCHRWTGQHNRSGYGISRMGRRSRLVHRIVWEYFNGPVPEELQLDHLCRTKDCCNPVHLRATTAKINVLASDNLCAQNARKTTCPKCGGEFSKRKNGGRYCRHCHIQKNSAYVKKRAAEDPEYRERLLEASRRYQEKRRTNPEAIQRGKTRPLNEQCPKCGGPYSTFPNGVRYCKPCRQMMLAAYRAQQTKSNTKD